jgi:alkyl hydroperoxide reductase subunit AhpF
MPVLRAEEASAVREHLAALERPVELALVLGPEDRAPGAPDVDFGAKTRELLEELVELGGGNLTLSLHEPPAFDARIFPAVCVLPEGEDAGIRYYGLPWGYELTSLVGACVDAGRREPRLRPESLQALARLERPLHVDVFVTPT